MTTWTLICPQCDTPNEVAADAVSVECGRVFCVCTCTNCTYKFGDKQPYWRWLGLEEEPPAEPDVAANYS